MFAVVIFWMLMAELISGGGGGSDTYCTVRAVMVFCRPTALVYVCVCDHCLRITGREFYTPAILQD